MLEHLEEINNLRRNIDAIDRQIIQLLAKRSEHVNKVGKIKNSHNSGNSIIRPGREAKMLRKILKANSGRFPSSAIANIWRIIITASVTIEQNLNLIAYLPKTHRHLLSLIYEYFGCFVPLSIAKNSREVIEKAARKNTIGILPVSDKVLLQSWFLKQHLTNKAPNIFACLPFVNNIVNNTPGGETLFCFGKVIPEKTRDDSSVLLIRTSQKNYVKLLRQSGFKASDLQEINFKSSGSSNTYLIKINEFILKNDKRINKAKETGVEVTSLGAYANPIISV